MNDEEDTDSSDSDSEENSDTDDDTEGDELNAAGDWNTVGEGILDLRA